MKSSLDVRLERLRRHDGVVRILAVCVRVHLITDVFGSSETAEVPTGELCTWKFPPPVPKFVRSKLFEYFSRRDDRSKPGLAREQVVE